MARWLIWRRKASVRCSTKYYPDINFGFAYLDSNRIGGVMLELIQKEATAERMAEETERFLSE
jgi:hypothetical protein